MKFKIGDRVEKVGGDYTFVGVVVAAFKKLSGVDRYVVEDDRGILHVYSDKILSSIEEDDQYGVVRNGIVGTEQFQA